MSSSALGNFLTIVDAKFEEGDSRARVGFGVAGATMRTIDTKTRDTALLVHHG